jgi:hypothetical protein
MDIGLDPHYVLSIEGPCKFRIGDIDYQLRGTPYDPEMEYLRTMANKLIVSANAHSNGQLEIVLEEGSTVSSKTDGDFEPWQISGPGGFLVVSMPSGGLTVW